jgi:hypothetical protein
MPERLRIDWGKALPPLQQNVRRQRLEGHRPQFGDGLPRTRHCDVLALLNTIHNVATVIAKVSNGHPAHGSM